MKRRMIMVVFLMTAMPSRGAKPLIQEAGTHIPAEGVSIHLAKVNADALGVVLKFTESGREAKCGTAKGESLFIVPGRWAAQFRAPHELWIYDGRSGVQLYERTTEPRGFRSTSSAGDSALIKRAPLELRKWIEDHRN